MSNARRIANAAWVLAAAGALAGCAYKKPEVVVDTARARIDAVSRLMQSAESPKPETRTCAIEAVADVLPDRARGVVLQGLRDEEPMVRSAAALAAGQLKLESAKPRLQDMAMFKTKDAEIDKRVYAAVLGALHRMGDTKHSSDLRDLLSDPDEETVRAQAAMGLALTGEKAAIELLKRRLEIEQSPLVKIQITEAMAQLGDTAALGRLEGHAFLTTDSSVAAMEAIARLRTPNAPDVLKVIAGRADQSPVRKAVAYGGLARMGEIPEANYEYCLQALRMPQTMLEKAAQPYGTKVEPLEIARLQRCAAVALGWMRRAEAVPDLQAVMARTDDGAVRVACAMGILRIIRPASPVAFAEPVRPATRPAEPAPLKQPRKPQVHSAGGKD